MKIITRVPENTIPYKCGERFMACTCKVVEEKTETSKGKLELDRCTDFFKTEEEARKFMQENPEYKWMVK
jgi:hypothetical protein